MKDSTRNMLIFIIVFSLIGIVTSYFLCNRELDSSDEIRNSSQIKKKSEPIKEKKLADKVDKIPSCKGCVFTYSVNEIYTLWNEEETPTILSYDSYSKNYEDIVKYSERDFFLGMVLDSNNKVSRAYVCGIKNNTPFCIEGTPDGSRSYDNRTLLQSNNLWNNECSGGASLNCDGEIEASDGVDGFVAIGNDDCQCSVDSDGTMVCELNE